MSEENKEKGLKNLCNIKILKGDCIDLIENIQDCSIDMILCDPPYGINFQSQRKKDKKQWIPKIIGDKKPFIEFIPLIKRVLKPSGCTMIFTRWDVQKYFIQELENNGFKVKNVLIWDKVIHGMGDLKRAYASRYESIIFSSEKEFKFPGKRPQDILVERRVMPKDLVHPNEKPIKLLEKLICQCTNVGDTIFDPFMGSGTTGIASINTGRNFIGIELDEKYFNLSKKRIMDSIA